MLEIKGKYASAKVYATSIEDYAMAQIQMICENRASEGCKIAIMPDAHPGKVGPVGLTMTVGDRVLPALIGPDIGCGIDTVAINTPKFEPQKLDRIIRECVPSGSTIRKRPHHRAEKFYFENINCKSAVNLEKARQSLGTLGSGNHFIEIDKSDSGKLYLTVHTGSRHFGMEVYEYYMRKGASIQEAAAYFRIGEKKLREMVILNPRADFILNNGNRVQIKRKLFEEYLNETSVI